MTDVAQSETLRRVRPWIAALLTFLGWGLGAYYAGKPKLAVLLSVFHFFSGLLLGLGIIFLALEAIIPPALLPAPTSIGYFDGVIWLISLPVAIFVLAKVWTIRQTRNRGFAGLFGYVALWGLPIIAAVAVALPVRAYVAQPFHIPSGSMRPSVPVNAYVVVDKMRFRDQSAAPARGEIIVFKNQQYNNIPYVSRLIGLPGDVIMIEQGEISINGEKVTRRREASNPDGGATYQETLDNGTSYLTIDHGIGPLDNIGPYEVPEGHYFFMSDNRDRAQDSRVISMVGYVPREHLLGPVTRIIPTGPGQL